jgi:hypothetical protein
MAQIANVEYFKNYCNKKLGTNYTWDSKQTINLYWVTYVVRKIYNDIHQPRVGCKHPISVKFSLSESEFWAKVIVDVAFVHTVIDYLANFDMICDIDCACPCECDCTACNCTKFYADVPYLSDCTVCSACFCGTIITDCVPCSFFMKTCQQVLMECVCVVACGSDCRCVCDCECNSTCAPYECHPNCAGSNCRNECIK